MGFLKVFGADYGVGIVPFCNEVLPLIQLLPKLGYLTPKCSVCLLFQFVELYGQVRNQAHRSTRSEDGSVPVRCSTICSGLFLYSKLGGFE